MNREILGKNISTTAGEIIMNWYKKENKIKEKGERDFTLTADLEAEKYLIELIKKNFPEDGILSEEIGETKGSSGYRWIVDPLDGTVNFKSGIPYFCVSIAIEKNDQIASAFVFNPINEQLYYAELGKGSYLNNKPIKVSTTNKIKKFLMSYSTSHHRDHDTIIKGSRSFKNLLLNCRAVRLMGSSILDLCNLANGVFDGLIKVGGNYWDIAAGCLIVEEAGGRVTDFYGNNWNKDTINLLASNGQNHQKLIRILEQ
jgi:myo-inositol-1(or 4)-monophosphatase